MAGAPSAYLSNAKACIAQLLSQCLHWRLVLCHKLGCVVRRIKRRLRLVAESFLHGAMPRVEALLCSLHVTAGPVVLGRHRALDQPVSAGRTARAGSWMRRLSHAVVQHQPGVPNGGFAVQLLGHLEEREPNGVRNPCDVLITLAGCDSVGRQGLWVGIDAHPACRDGEDAVGIFHHTLVGLEDGVDVHLVCGAAEVCSVLRVARVKHAAQGVQGRVDARVRLLGFWPKPGGAVLTARPIRRGFCRGVRYDCILRQRQRQRENNHGREGHW